MASPLVSGTGAAGCLGFLDRGWAHAQDEPATADPGTNRHSRRLWDRLLSSDRASRLASLIILAAAYFLLGMLGLYLVPHVKGYGVWPPLVWPAAGVGLGGLLLLGRRAWPALAVGGFLAGLFVLQAFPPLGPLASHWLLGAGGIAAGQTAAAVVGTTLLRARNFDRSLVRLHDALCLFVLGAGVSSALSAAVGTAVLWGIGSISSRVVPLFLGTWWVSEVTGVILVTPLLLVLRNAFTPGADADSCPYRAKTGTALMVTAVVAGLVFLKYLPLIFLVFPLVSWAARRLGVPGVAPMNVVLVGAAILAAGMHLGPFIPLKPPHTFVALQAFVASMAMVSLALAVVSDECHRALKKVRLSQDRILEAANRVRGTVRTDLHDSISPTIAAAILQLEVAEELIGTDPAEAKELIGVIQVHARRVMEEIRRLIDGLGPQNLDTRGLVHALKQRALQFSRMPSGPASRGTLQVKFESAGDLESLPDQVKLAVYHIVSEALNNASRHGGANSCWVNLTLDESVLTIEVTDDGHGLPENFKPGLGLASMRERARELKGRCTAENAPGGGTVVRAHLPVAREDRDVRDVAGGMR